MFKYWFKTANPRRSEFLRAKNSILMCFLLFSCAESPTHFAAGRANVGNVWIEEVDQNAIMYAELQDPPEGYETMIAEFRSSYQEALYRSVDQQVYDQLESVFLTGGLRLELANYYKEVVELQGPNSPLRARLAWYYEQLGISTSALREAELAVENRAEDPMAHFVLGYLMLRREESVRANFHFTRSRELDEDFQGPFGLSANRYLSAH